MISEEEYFYISQCCWQGAEITFCSLPVAFDSCRASAFWAGVFWLVWWVVFALGFFLWCWLVWFCWFGFLVAVGSNSGGIRCWFLVKFPYSRDQDTMGYSTFFKNTRLCRIWNNPNHNHQKH